LITSIRAALSTAGVTNTAVFDPITSNYAYDGTGVDAVIESISLTRNPSTGATQLQAKLAPLATGADGSVTPVLISASTPLGTSQVAIASNPALTFGKIKAWVDFVNSCLSATPPPDSECTGLGASRFVALNYKNNSKDFAEDFLSLFSETNRQGVIGSVVRNPNILYIGRYNGSTIDDLAVVEVTVRQPRTGPLAGNIATPIEYTKTLVFKRDEVTSGLKAGNWVLQGNQRNFDWAIRPAYLTLLQQNPARQADVAGSTASRTTSGLNIIFNSRVFNQATRSFDAPSVYAVRFKGPGLPVAGIVLVPSTGTASQNLFILNKTGVVPAQGTTVQAAQSTFRFSSALYPSGLLQSTATWPGGQAYYANSPTSTDFASLQAFNAYSAEIYVNGSTTPTVETSRILAPIEAPASYVQRPLHDLRPSLALITPPASATSSVTLSWVRNPLAVKIERAFFYYVLPDLTNFTSSITLPDSSAINANSTSVTFPVAPQTAPAFAVPQVAREVGISGTAAGASFQQSIYWSN
jgi:hypothetical protein